MKLIKYILLSISGIFLLQNGFSQNSVFALDIEAPEKLLPVFVEIDEESIARAYGSSLINTEIGYEDGELSGEYITEMFYQDQKVNDAYNVLDVYTRNYLVDEKDTVYGRIKLDVLFYDYDFRVLPGAYINVFTFGLGYLFGLPNVKEISIVELRADIFDINQNKIFSFMVSGKETSLKGLYYKKKNQRFCNLAALKKAVYQINEQINLQMDEISSGLSLP